MRNIIWADRAFSDFNHQIEHIAVTSPDGARLVVGRLSRAIDNLQKPVTTGRFGRFPGTYEKVVRGTSCIVVYTKDDTANAITIVRIVHASREWLAGTLPC